MPPATSDFVRGMARLSVEERNAFIESLPRAIRRRIKYTWELWARPGQLWRPGPETYEIDLRGRGAGKTRKLVEAVRYVAMHPELCGGVIGIAGRTANDVNRTLIHGDSGLMNCYPPNERPKHWKSDKIIEWKRTGVIARLFSGDVPESFRGPNVGFFALDEFAHWARIKESWEAAKFMLRLGKHVRALITTTPIGVETLERLVWKFDKDTDAPIVADDSVPPDRQLQGFVINPASKIVVGSTYENAANLADNFLEEIVASSAGTDLAAQEIDGLILRDNPTAIFRRSWLRYQEQGPSNVDLVFVMIDPSGGKDPQRAKTAEVGMVVFALTVDGFLHVLQDASGRMTPEQWGARAWALVDHWGADVVVAESNFGGEMVPTTLRAARPRADVKAIVRTVEASRDKAARAALTVPVVQSGRVTFCGDSRTYVHLARQLTSWDPTKPKHAQPSPDRLDAFVWGILYAFNAGSDRMAIRAFPEALSAAVDEIRRRLG